MKVLVINGSPKAGKSNTLKIAKAFVNGFPDNTAVEYANLIEMNIKPCMGCFSCWSKTPGKCVIKDDMDFLYDKIKSADIIIESFPLYFFGMPSVLKAMTDRCLPFMLPYMGNLTENESASFHELRDKEMEKKKLVIISTCGYVRSDPMYPALIKQLDLICGEGNYTSVICPEGELFIAEKAKRQREGYLKDVAEAGKEFADNLSLSSETLLKLSKPILSPVGFETITLAHWRSKGALKD